MSTTLTLTEFLLRRIADDEYRARQAQGDQWPDLVDALGMYVNIPNRWHIAGWGPARVLDECEAKRRIVTLMGYVRESWENKHSGEGRVMWPDVNRREKLHALTILENLALPYADHPDYRDEWRP